MFCWPHFKTCCFDLVHQEQYLLRKQQHETPHSGSRLAYSAVRTLPTRRSSLAQTFFLLVPVLSGEVLWNLRNFSRAGEQLNAQTHLPVTGWKDIFSQAVSIKSFGKIEVAFPKKKSCSYLLHVQGPQCYSNRAACRHRSAQKGKKSWMGTNLLCLPPQPLPLQLTAAIPSENTNAGISFCSRWSMV